MDEFLTTEEIAKLLKVHVVSVRRWIDAGKLPAIKIGIGYRVTKKDFEEFLNKNRKKL